MLHYGLDVHKRGSVYCCMDPSGQVVGKGELDHSPQAALEATGSWQHVAALLQEAGASVVPSHPGCVRA